MIRTEQDVTAAVLAELARSPNRGDCGSGDGDGDGNNERFKTIMASAIKHLHAFVRDT